MNRLLRRQAGAQSEPAAVWTYRFHDRLPSADDHLAFTAEIRLDWSVEDASRAAGVSNLLAARHVGRIVQEAAAHVSVLRVAVAEHEINLALVTRLPCSTDGVRVHRAQTRLLVDEETLEAARRLERARQDQGIDALHQERLRARMRFMREEALRDPAAARLYWLLEHPDQANPQAQAAVLEEIVQQVNLWSNGDRWITIAQLLHRFIERLPDSRRDRLVDQLGKVFVEYGQGDLAEEMPGPLAVPSSDRIPAGEQPHL